VEAEKQQSMSRTPRRSQVYIAHVVPGLETIAESEILETLDVERPFRVLREFDERTSLLLFPYGGSPLELLGLGTVEDVFALAAESDSVPSNRAGLAAVRAAVAQGPAFGAAVERTFTVRPRRRGKTTFRVIARKSGEHAFRRVDLQRAVELGVLDRLPAWRLVEDDAQIEVWVNLVGRQMVVGIRLSDRSMRQREYQRTSLPAALKPTVARAMALLSEPREDDVVLDPMCGSGTILIERAEAARYRLLLGGDVEESAVRAARENIGPRYKPIELQQWDARTLPLEDDSVSAIITNLPFGKQIGTPEANRTLYPALLAEWVRILRDGGRMVLLTGDGPLLLRAVQRQPQLTVVRRMPVLVRGYRATLVVVTMGSAPMERA
jgi:tRNA (guanine6-N2)-methyltransferase